MAKRTVVAGTWQIQTNDPGTARFPSLDVTGIFPLDTKISTMEQVVTDFYDGAQSLLVHSSIPPLYIFVAPEYYFKRTLTQRCLTKEERDTARTAMSILAQSKPNLLLIPGTVTWRKPLDKKAYAKAMERMAGRIELGGYSGVTKLPKPSGFFGKGTAKADAAYNTAYLYMGPRIMKYHKMEDVGELAEEDEGAIFIPGNGNNVFTISGLRIGMEICGDHESHRLKEMVDVHIISSASVVRTDEHVMAKNGGLFIRADSGKAEITMVDRHAVTPLSEAPGTVITPQIGGNGAMQAAFDERWGTTKQLSRATWAKHPDQKAPKKLSVQEDVRMAYGGKLTTAVVEVDTL